jgi:hypothetical protein
MFCIAVRKQRSHERPGVLPRGSMQDGLDTEPNQPVIAGSPVWERPSGWLRVRLVSCRSKLIMRSGSDDAEAASHTRLRSKGGRFIVD